MVVEDVLLESTFPELLPAGASARTAAACLVANSDQQTGRQRPRSVRMSSSEEGSRSTDEEERPADKALHREALRWNKALV